MAGMNIKDLEQAAILNCVYCQGIVPGIERNPAFVKSWDTWAHENKNKWHSDKECTSARLWTHIIAIEKSTQQKPE